MTPIAERAKRMMETPLGSRVMLPHFGSRRHELIDKIVNEEWRLLFIKHNFECFYNTVDGELWDKEIEPKQVIFTKATSNGEIDATVELITGEEIAL